jgi:hypothetical protein
MKPLCNLLEIKQEGENLIYPIFEICKKAFLSTKIECKNNLRVFYHGHVENPKITVIYGKNKLIINKSMHVIAIGKDFDEKGAKNKLKEFL